MTEPEWVAYDVVLAVHEAQLAEHGGSAGIRDHTLLESGLERPRNVYAYSEGASLYDLASAYAIGIAKNHAFLDGNKRTAWVVCATFLELNGVMVIADQRAVVTMLLGLADGSVQDHQFALWLQEADVTVRAAES